MINSILTLLTLAVFSMGGYFEALSQYTALTTGGKVPSDAKIFALLGKVNWPILVIGFIVSSLLSIMVSTACLRKEVRHEEIGKYGLSWGNDEKQLLIAILQLFGLFILGYIAIIIVMTIFAVLKLSLLNVIPLVGLVLFIFFFIGRYGIYGVLTIANKKASAMASYNYTKEQFWSFLGAFVLNGIIVMIISMLLSTILGAIFAPLMSDAIGRMPSSMAGFFSIGSLLYFGLTGAIGGALHIAMVCTGAYAYHKINEKTEAAQAN